MTHYEEEVGPDLATRFHREFEEVALQIERYKELQQIPKPQPFGPTGPYFPVRLLVH